jgi:hypothetical protein
MYERGETLDILPWPGKILPFLWIMYSLKSLVRNLEPHPKVNSRRYLDTALITFSNGDPAITVRAAKALLKQSESAPAKREEAKAEARAPSPDRSDSNESPRDLEADDDMDYMNISDDDSSRQNRDKGNVPKAASNSTKHSKSIVSATIRNSSTCKSTLSFFDKWLI